MPSPRIILSRRTFNAIFACTLYLLSSAVSIKVSAIERAKKIRNTHYKFSLRIPRQMYEVWDSCNSPGDQVFYDTSARIIMMISARESKFRSVAEYLSCSSEKLQETLRNNFGDSTLQLIRCSRSLYYPDRITVLHFRVSVLPFQYDTHTIYFIHHRHRDIQVSFTYKNASVKQNAIYMNTIMQTLKLSEIP